MGFAHSLSRLLLCLILGPPLRSLPGDHETSRKGAVREVSLRVDGKLLSQDLF